MSWSLFGKILHLGVPAKEFLKRVYYNTAERVDISDWSYEQPLDGYAMISWFVGNQLWIALFTYL